VGEGRGGGGEGQPLVQNRQRFVVSRVICRGRECSVGRGSVRCSGAGSSSGGVANQPACPMPSGAAAAGGGGGAPLWCSVRGVVRVVVAGRRGVKRREVGR